MTDEQPPAPLEWHPAYQGNAWLSHWLEDTTATDRARLPVWRRARLSDYVDAPSPVDMVSAELVLTKRTAYGWAPYVGDRFVYVWTTATDQLGRSIATDTRIAYTP